MLPGSIWLGPVSITSVDRIDLFEIMFKMIVNFINSLVFKTFATKYQVLTGFKCLQIIRFGLFS